MIDHDHWCLHAKTEQIVSTYRPMALYRIMYPHRSRNHMHVDRNNKHTNPRAQAPVSGGFSFGADNAASLTESDPEQRCNNAGLFVVTKAPEKTPTLSFATRLFLTRKAPHCSHCWVIIAPYIGPSSAHYRTIIDPGSYMRQYRAVIGPTKNQVKTMGYHWS